MNPLRWICTFTKQTPTFAFCILPAGVGDRLVETSGTSVCLRYRGTAFYRVSVERRGEGEGQWVLGAGWKDFFVSCLAIRPCTFFFERTTGDMCLVRVYEEKQDNVCSHTHGFLITYTGSEEHGLTPVVGSKFEFEEGVNVLQARGSCWQGDFPLSIHKTGDILHLEDAFFELMEVCDVEAGDKVIFQYRGGCEWVVRMFRASGVEITTLPSPPPAATPLPVDSMLVLD